MESNLVFDAASAIEIQQGGASSQQDMLAIVNPFGIRIARAQREGCGPPS
jgi:hypothetical protein